MAVKKVVEALEERGLFTGWGQDASADGDLETHSPRNPHGAIWVVAETDPQGNLRPVTFELLGAAEKLANTSGRAVAAVIMGHGVEVHTAGLAAHGADIVFVADHPVLANYSTAPYTQVLADAIQTQNPFAVLLPATVNGRDLAARLAARLGLGLTGDCIDLDINDLGQLVQYKPAFGGNIVSPILSKTTPQMATVRPGMLARAKRSDSRTAVVEQMAVSDKASVNAITVVSSEEESGSFNVFKAKQTDCGITDRTLATQGTRRNVRRIKYEKEDLTLECEIAPTTNSVRFMSVNGRVPVVDRLETDGLEVKELPLM